MNGIEIMAMVVACGALVVALVALVFSWLTRRDKMEAFKKL